MYYLFGGDDAYPSGGVRDYAGAFDEAFDTIDAAMEGAYGRSWGWAQVAFLTTDTRELVRVATWRAGEGWTFDSD